MYLVKIQNILVEYRLIGTLEFFFEKVSNDILGIHSLNNVKNDKDCSRKQIQTNIKSILSI